jgi:hypothetical protein
LNKSSPRNHQERTAVSRGGGGSFLLGKSKNLSQRTDNHDLAVATLFAGADFDPIKERTDDFDSLRACRRKEPTGRDAGVQDASLGGG